MTTLTHMCHGFVATWPIWLFIAILVGASFAILGDEQKTRKAQRITDARAEESRKTLAYLNDPAAQESAAESYQRHAEELARYQRAGAYRRNFGQSPANQQTPAPWFGSDGAA